MESENERIHFCGEFTRQTLEKRLYWVETFKNIKNELLLEPFVHNTLYKQSLERIQDLYNIHLNNYEYVLEQYNICVEKEYVVEKEIGKNMNIAI